MLLTTTTTTTTTTTMMMMMKATINELDIYEQIVSSPTYSGLLECQIIQKTQNNTLIASITGTTTSTIQRGIITFNNFGIQGVEGSIAPIEISCIRNELANVIDEYNENNFIIVLLFTVVM